MHSFTAKMQKTSGVRPHEQMDLKKHPRETGQESAGEAEATRALAARWRSGEPGAFRAVVDRFRGPLLAYVLSMLRDLQDAEDVVQETLMRAHASVHQLNDPGSLWGWLRRIAHNAAVDAARASGRRGTPTDPAAITAMGECIPEEEPRYSGPGLSIGEIVRAIEALPGTYREAAVYHYLEEWPYARIADTLGIDQAAARQRISRAGKMLRTMLRTERGAEHHDM